MPEYPDELQTILDTLPLREEYRVPDHEDVPYFATGLQVRAVRGDFLVTESPTFADIGGPDTHDFTCKLSEHTLSKTVAGPPGTYCCRDCRAVKFPAAYLDGVAV